MKVALRMRSTIAALLMLVAAGAAVVAAPGAQLNVELAAACVQSQQRAVAIAEQVSRRVEAARQNVSPAEMRVAIDDLQSGLSLMRTATEACVIAPVAAPTGSAAAKPAAAVDHAAMGHGAAVGKPVEVDPELVRACVGSQQQMTALAGRLNRGLELARQTNAAADMHAAVAALPAALGETRAALQKCEPLRTSLAAAQATAAAAVAAATMDHSKMAMAGTPAAGAQPAAPMDHSKMAMGTAAAKKPSKPATAAAPMDHSKMPMEAAAPAAKPGAAAKAKPTQPGAPATPAEPMDHSKMAMPGKAPATGGDHTGLKMDTPKLPVIPAARIADPACPANVTQANAPKAVYQRKVYFFCSTADRDLFRKDPARYLKQRPR